jgi:hypothetical protein
MTIWHTYYLVGAGSGVFIAALFASAYVERYATAPGWYRKEMLPNICWLIFAHGISWPTAGLLVAASFYLYRGG